MSLNSISSALFSPQRRGVRKEIILQKNDFLNTFNNHGNRITTKTYTINHNAFYLMIIGSNILSVHCDTTVNHISQKLFDKR